MGTKEHWDRGHLPLGEIDTVWNTNDPTNPLSLGGSADRKSIDIVRHKVEERPQEPVRSDAPHSADTKSPIQPANAR